MLSLRAPNLRYDRIYWILFVVITVVILIGAVSRKKNSFADTTEVEVVPLEGGDKMIS